MPLADVGHFFHPHINFSSHLHALLAPSGFKVRDWCNEDIETKFLTYFQILVKCYLKDIVTNVCPFASDYPIIIFLTDPNIAMADKMIFMISHFKKFPVKAENMLLLAADVIERSKHFFLKRRDGYEEKDNNFIQKNSDWLDQYYTDLMHGFIFDSPRVIYALTTKTDPYAKMAKIICDKNTYDQTKPLVTIPDEKQWRYMIKTCQISQFIEGDDIEYDKDRQTFIPGCFY